VKTFLCKVAEQTNETLWRTIGQLMERFQADEYPNFSSHSGYVSSKK
jgi:hypothetical protein